MVIRHTAIVAAMLASVGLAQASTMTALSESFDNGIGAWKFSSNGSGYKVASTTTFDPGFGTGSYMTPVGASYDDATARALESTAKLVAGGKVTYSFDYYLSNNSKAYNLRFGIYSGSSMVKNGFAAWGSALTDSGAQTDWKGYTASLTVNGLSDSLLTTRNIASTQDYSGSNFLWGAWGSGLGATTTYGASPVRNDGNARTVIMELLLSESNVLTVNLYEGIKGAVSSTPVVTMTITNASYIVTDFNYVGLLIRSNGSSGSSGDYLAVDNVNVTVVTPDAVPEAATLGFLMAGSSAFLCRRRR